MPPFSEFPKTPSSLTVLYEDNHLIAVFKPAGVLTQGDKSGEASLIDHTREWLREKYAKPGNVFVGLIHRLDRPVAGVVLFAKTSKGASRLSEQFRARGVRKIYRAIVERAPIRATAELSHFMGGEGDRGVVVSEDDAPGLKPARLRYVLMERLSNGALLEIELGTGRKHQIRAQLAFVGCPIAGDKKYGAKRVLPGGAIALVAKRLEFRHPVRPEEIVSVEVPEALCPLRSLQ